MKKYAALTLLFLVLSCSMASAKSWIRINQLGYIPNSTKVAVLLCEEETEISGFKVVDAFTGESVLESGTVRATGPLGRMESTFRLDFSSLVAEGAYYIVAGGAKSGTFPVNPRVYDGAADFVLNYMRQQRCGWNPAIKDSCHTKDAYIVGHPDPLKDSTRLDVTGGWHDASDCLQYTTTSANAIYQMMFAFRSNPSAFPDNYLADGTPGRNGIPDIVDEIYWGLTWLDKMNPAPGEMYNQIADDRDHRGMRIPSQDNADYGWGPGNGRPVWFCSGEKQQRGSKGLTNATMGIASTAGKYASDFALGSEVLKPFYPEFAERIGAKAKDCYDAGVAKPGNCQTASVLSPYIYEEDNWVDDMELAAFELFRQTGERKYLTEAVEYGRKEPVTPWMGADSARHYQWYPFMNMGHVHLAHEAGGKVSAEFLRNMRTGIERVYDRGKDHPFLYGIPGIWCSNNLTTAMLTQCILYRELTGDRRFEEMEGSLRDWLLGCNPWGVSMIVELPSGGVYPTQPHSYMVSLKLGNTTGGLVDGPVYSTIFGSLLGISTEGGINYEEFQPGDLVYHDSTHDYSTNEPTMDGTASLTFPLSYYEMAGRGSIGMADRSHPRLVRGGTGAERSEASGGAERSEESDHANTTSADRNVYRDGGIIRTDPAVRNIHFVFTAADKADGADWIIKTLRDNNIRGGFFFTGEFYETFPDVIRRLVSEGHYVGSHSYGHLLYASWEDHDSLLVSKEEFQEDMVRSYSLMRSFGITDAPVFIPPYEHYNKTVASWAKELGLQIINYTPGTSTNGDYTTPDMKNYYSSKKILDNIWKREKADPDGLNGYILLIHLGTEASRKDKFYDHLPGLIRKLRRKGYSFIPLREK